LSNSSSTELELAITENVSSHLLAMKFYLTVASTTARQFDRLH